jgi:electron transfer flavoprotein alpha/beta subunit
VGLAGSSTQVIKVFFPQRVTQAEILTGNLEQQLETLLEKLREAKLV